MRMEYANIKSELIKEVTTLPSGMAKDVLEYVCFIKARKAIDPTQSYFWTKTWQMLEKKAAGDIKNGRVKNYKSVRDFKKTIGD